MTARTDGSDGTEVLARHRTRTARPRRLHHANAECMELTAKLSPRAYLIGLPDELSIRIDTTRSGDKYANKSMDWLHHPCRGSPVGRAAGICPADHRHARRAQRHDHNRWLATASPAAKIRRQDRA